MTEFDMITQPDYIQLLKAILPFMEYNMQRSISTLIRTSELKNTIRFYSSPVNCNIFKSCCNSSGINFNTPISEILGNEQLINTVKTYCSGNIVNMINTYRNLNKMSDMFNMMDIFNNSSSNNSSSNNDEIHNDKNNNDGNNNYKSNSSINTSDMLGNIMNSNQKDLYNEYIKQLDSLDFNVSQNESR
jgi:probable serine/threonine-protein kinase tsuA